MSAAEAPVGLRAGGQQLWRALIARDASILGSPRYSLAESACRAKDRADAFHEFARDAPTIVKNAKGRPVLNPAIREERLNSVQMLSLIAALRLPDRGDGHPAPVRRLTSVPNLPDGWPEDGDSSA